MAAVYRARDTQLDRIVAVKVFSTDDTRDVVRREAEAQTLARLNHPNLVTLFDAHLVAPGETGPSYIVMELVDGPSLREELDRGPLPAGEVAVLTAEIAEALVAVHAAGIVHRDLKPANILLSLTGLPSLPYRGKLADFGIAHLVGSERITTDGMVVGTAAYLSPEQARGDEPGPPSDVYALALILIEALTGRRAFIGTAAESIATRLVLDVPIPPGLPPAWAQLLTEMTARDPAARPDALDVAMRARENAADLVGWIPVATDLAPTAVLEVETERMSPPFPVLVPDPAVPDPAVPDPAAPDPAAPDPAAALAPTLAMTRHGSARSVQTSTDIPEETRRRRMVVATVSTVGALAVAGIILFAAFAANAPGAGSGVTHSPSGTPIPAAPVATTPPSPSVTPGTVVPNPGPTSNGNGNSHGNGHGNGKGKGDK